MASSQYIGSCKQKNGGKCRSVFQTSAGKLTLLHFIPTFIRLADSLLHFLTDRILFLTEISVFLSILLISYRDFGIFIDLLVFLTEHLGKIGQSLQTGCKV